MIQTTDDILQAINSDVDSIISKMIADLIRSHRAGEGKKRKRLWDRYTLEDVPIYHTKPAKYEKVHNEIANDFYADIVDTKTGYMGNEITVGLDRESYKLNGELQETIFDNDRKILKDFQMKSYSEDVNSEMVRLAGGTGVGYRLLYVPMGQNEVKTMNLYPWEVIYVYDESLDEAQLALRFYTVESKEYGYNGKVKEITKVEWYDKEYIRYYIDDGDMNFRLDTTKQGS